MDSLVDAEPSNIRKTIDPGVVISDPVIPRTDNSDDVIPGNVPETQVSGKFARCTVNIEHLCDPKDGNSMVSSNT